ncbi:unnamed protein product [Pleuronectes platessa]|uniref:Uncharacterized protein n=1 Tax=Pleuronectes platessa TaxID=8262 RepID=A0A9N7TSC5_PLEPL|nr:unnamed protein product [Pleuronectes platessa]
MSGARQAKIGTDTLCHLQPPHHPAPTDRHDPAHNTPHHSSDRTHPSPTTTDRDDTMATNCHTTTARLLSSPSVHDNDYPPTIPTTDPVYLADNPRKSTKFSRLKKEGSHYARTFVKSASAAAY